MSEKLTFNIGLIGPHKSGKTTCVKRIHSGEFIKDYQENCEKSVTPVAFNIRLLKSKKNVVVELNMAEHDSTKKDAYMILVDGTNFDEKTMIQNMEFSKGEKRIIAINKCDLKRKFRSIFNKIKAIDKDAIIYQTSYKSNYNFEKPFKSLIDQLLYEDTNFIDVN